MQQYEYKRTFEFTKNQERKIRAIAKRRKRLSMNEVVRIALILTKEEKILEYFDSE